MTIDTAGIEAQAHGEASDRILATTLSSLDARLKHLEQPRPKKVFERMQKNASFLALIIGIVLSLISLFDIFWNKPRESLLRDIDEFNKSVNAVANLRQQMIQSSLQSNNPEMSLAISGMVMPQVLAHIQSATKILPRIAEHAEIPQLIVLITEAINIYDWRSAEILVERAVADRTAVPTLQSEAQRYKGRLMFLTHRLQPGRMAFREALRVLEAESAFGINGTRAFVVGDWMIYEYTLGDCAEGDSQASSLMNLLQHPDIPLPARAGLIATVNRQLRDLGARGGRCLIPPVMQSIN